MRHVRLKYAASVNRCSLTDSQVGDFDFYYIDISAVTRDGKIEIPSSPISYSSAPSRARRVAPAGSTVVSTVRTYLRAIGAVPHTSERLIFSTGFAVLEAKAGVDSRYLTFACRSPQFVEELVARSVGVSYPAISPSDLAQVAIPVPTLDIQRRVAAFLEQESRRRDLFIETRLRQIRELEELALSEIDENLPDVADGAWPRVGYLAEVRTGVTVDGGRRAAADWVDRPYLRVANVQAGYLALNDVSHIRVPRELAWAAKLKSGDILMTEGGDLDKLGRGSVWRNQIPDCIHQNHIFAVRFRGDLVESDYLALLTRASFARSYFESTGNRTTNLASTSSYRIRDFRFPLPSRRIQREYVRRVSERLGAISDSISLMRRQNDLLRERFASLTAAVVSGQIDVSTARGIDV